MCPDPTDRLSDAELKAFLDAMYPHGVAGADVMGEIASDGWARSPLVACFHPPIERVLEEQARVHRRIVELGIRGRGANGAGTDRANADRESIAPPAEPTLARLQETWQAEPIKPLEELTELVGLCLWDVFADNHEVLDATGRVVDLGSFRGAAAFLDGYISGHGDAWCREDYMRFYLGTFAIDGRADLTPVYASIFRRLMERGGTWVYHFPELFLVELGSADDEGSALKPYSPNEAIAAERKAKTRRDDISRLQADLAEAHEARDDAMDRLPPVTVR